MTPDGGMQRLISGSCTEREGNALGLLMRGGRVGSRQAACVFMCSYFIHTPKIPSYREAPTSGPQANSPDHRASSGQPRGKKLTNTRHTSATRRDTPVRARGPLATLELFTPTNKGPADGVRSFYCEPDEQLKASVCHQPRTYLYQCTSKV